MSIQSATKFVAEVSMKIRRLRNKLHVGYEFLPPDEKDEILVAIRALESEMIWYEKMMDMNDRLALEAERLFKEVPV